MAATNLNSLQVLDNIQPEMFKKVNIKKLDENKVN